MDTNKEGWEKMGKKYHLVQRENKVDADGHKFTPKSLRDAVNDLHGMQVPIFHKFNPLELVGTGTLIYVKEEGLGIVELKLIDRKYAKMKPALGFRLLKSKRKKGVDIINKIKIIELTLTENPTDQTIPSIWENDLLWILGG